MDRIAKTALRALAAAALLSTLPLAAHAEGPTVGIDIGTRGPNLELGYSINPQFGLRAVGTDFTYHYTTTRSNDTYKGNLDLRSLSLLGDWYPMQGAFRITAGAVFDNDDFSGTVQSNNGFVTLNGVTFPVAPGDRIDAKASWPHSVVPYLGIGFGNPAQHKNGFSATADFGAMFTDHPTATLTAEGPDAANPVFVSELQQEQNNLNKDLHKISVWPVASVGIYYAY